MKFVYTVIALLFSAVAWICTQTTWEYQYIIEYIAIFFASLLAAIVFVAQEGNDGKKYTLFSIVNIIYIVVLLAVILIGFSRFSLVNWQTVTGSFWKAIFVLNLIQSIVLMAFFKIRDLFFSM